MERVSWAIHGKLFEGLPLLKGRHYFCDVLFAHMGDESIIRDRLQGMVDNLAKSGAFVHDDCYALLKGMAPEFGIKLPFKPLSVFERLRDYLKANQSNIKKLGIKAVYQRPCASRYTPEKDPVVDEIFDLIGVTRVKRKYEGEDALCCGVELTGPNLKLFPRGKNFEPFRYKNILDAKEHGAEAMVYLFHVLQDTGKENARGRHGQLHDQRHMQARHRRDPAGRQTVLSR